MKKNFKSFFLLAFIAFLFLSKAHNMIPSRDTIKINEVLMQFREKIEDLEIARIKTKHRQRWIKLRINEINFNLDRLEKLMKSPENDEEQIKLLEQKEKLIVEQGQLRKFLEEINKILELTEKAEEDFIQKYEQQITTHLHPSTIL